MKVLKHSRQRDAIKQYLDLNRTHPTADEVYESLRREFPNISLGTVYRNLNLLSGCGEIRKLSYGGGPDRFDCECRQHDHFVCRSCGRVYDMPKDTERLVSDSVLRDAPGTVETHDLVFYGICRDCLSEEQGR